MSLSGRLSCRWLYPQPRSWISPERVLRTSVLCSQGILPLWPDAGRRKQWLEPKVPRQFSTPVEVVWAMLLQEAGLLPVSAAVNRGGAQDVLTSQCYKTAYITLASVLIILLQHCLTSCLVAGTAGRPRTQLEGGNQLLEERESRGIRTYSYKCIHVALFCGFIKS